MGKKTAWPRTRYPSLRGALVVRPVRGVLTAQAWPKPRRGRRHPTNEYWSNWLAEADDRWKFAPDVFQIAARKAARGSPQMPRDLFIAAARGRLWMLTLEDGTKVYPMCAYRDVSESLDVLSQVKGSLLVRSGELWIPVPIPDHKTVLTFDMALGLPEWQDTTGASSNYSAPLAAAFTLLTGSPAPTLAQAPPGPLVLGRAPASASPRIGAALHVLSAVPRRYTFGLRHFSQLLTNNAWGLVLRDHATGRLITFSYRMITPSSAPQLNVDYWTNDTLFASTPLFRVVTHQNTLFLRITDSGGNFIFAASADDANYATVATLSRTAWLANPSHVGFQVTSGAIEALASALAAFHYVNEAA